MEDITLGANSPNQEDSNPVQSADRLVIREAATLLWRKTGSWAIFLAVISLLLGLIYTVASLYGLITTLNSTPADPVFVRNVHTYSVTGLIILLVMSILFVAMSIFHLFFGVKIRQAMARREQQSFENSWAHLLNHLRIFGVFMTLFALGLTVLGISYLYLIVEFSRRFSG